MTNCLSSSTSTRSSWRSQCHKMLQFMQRNAAAPPLCSLHRLATFYAAANNSACICFSFFSLSLLLNVGHKLLRTVRFVWFGFVTFRFAVCSLQFAVFQHISVRCPLLQLRGFHSPSSLFMLSILYSYINTCCMCKHKYDMYRGTDVRVLHGWCNS